MTMSPQMQKLLDALPPEQQAGFFQVWEAIYTSKFTGPVTVDCYNGVPKQMSFGRPIQLLIAEGLDPAPPG